MLAAGIARSVAGWRARELGVSKIPLREALARLDSREVRSLLLSHTRATMVDLRVELAT